MAVSALPSSLVGMTWHERAEEAAALAKLAGTASTGSRLLALLLDPEDSAVSQAAAAPLLARRDVTGLRLFVDAFGRAQEDARDKLGDWLYDEPDLWGFVRQSLPLLGEDESPAVRRGAAAVTEHMTAEELRHRR